MLTMGEVLSSPTHCAGRPAHSQVPCDLWDESMVFIWFYLSGKSEMAVLNVIDESITLIQVDEIDINGKLVMATFPACQAKKHQ